MKRSVPLLSPRLVHAAVVATGLSLAAAGCGGNSSPTEPSSQTGSGSAVYYAAIGASDAAGVGGSIPCVPFTDCPNGTGYVQEIARQLAATGATVTLSNLGIPAAVIGPDIQTLGNQYGRNIPANFIEQEVPFVPRNSTIVTIFAGGNDTNTIATAVGNGAGGGDPAGYMDQQIRAFGDDYARLIKGIKDRAPSARIVVANLPNFAGIPMTAAYSVANKQIMQKISVGLVTQVINPLTSQGIQVVDLMCDSRMYDPGIFSADGFHPNDNGYRNMANEMVRAITSGSAYGAPRTSCSQMTLVPPL